MAKVISGHQTLKNELNSVYGSIAVSVVMIVLALGFMALKLITDRNMIFLIVIIPVVMFIIDLKKKVQKVGIIKAGIAGEKKALRDLRETLPDSYTILNCVNVYEGDRKSQIDNIIVGPAGVTVCEVKSINGDITGSTDQRAWTVSKKAGGRRVTKQMYNPIMQVSTHAERTGRYLKKEGFDTWVRGMVYFADDRSKLHVDGPKSDIQLFTTGMKPWLKKYVEGGEDRLSKKEIEEICRSLAE